METFKERNLCVEAGCKAACCHNAYIPASREEATRIFPDATYIPRDSIPDVRVPGIYAAVNPPKSSADVMVRIVGACPHLDRQTNDCMIYEDRPEACRGLEKGDNECRRFRIASGFVPLDQLEIQK